MIDWNLVSKSFVDDGSLRDIYVQNTSINDWDALLSGLKNYQPQLKIEWDNQFGQWPDNASVIFDESNEFVTTMKIDASGILINCHFFSKEEIEFDIDPKDVTEQSDLDALCEFMRMVGKVVEKPAILTPENFQDKPIILFNPETNELNFIENFER